MCPEPPYTPADLDPPRYQLRYTWTGWPSRADLPDEPEPPFWDDLADAWETDGIRSLERTWEARRVRMLVSTTPDVAPTTLAQRMKGRLSYALGQADKRTDFSRKKAVRSVGSANRQTVEEYVDGQVDGDEWADPEFADHLEQFTVTDETVDLSEPSRSRSGRYWYNLHLVLVVAHRHRITNGERLGQLRDCCRAVADKKGHGLKALSVMPDHLHAALRADISESPEEVALAYMNNLAHAVGPTRLWQPSYYVGTFGEYDMGAIRANLAS
jgi:REP element-mobilizing transposase RayT